MIPRCAAASPAETTGASNSAIRGAWTPFPSARTWKQDRWCLCATTTVLLSRRCAARYANRCFPRSHTRTRCTIRRQVSVASAPASARTPDRPAGQSRSAAQHSTRGPGSSRSKVSLDIPASRRRPANPRRARIEDAPLSLNHIRPAAAGQFGITGEPRGAVPGHVELRHHADAAVARVFDDLANFFLRIKNPVGALLVQFGKFPALSAESLIFRKVPVKDIHLHGFHPVQIALYGVERNKMPARVDHQPAPRKARTIFDVQRRNTET